MSRIDNFLNKQNQSNYYINTLPTAQAQTAPTQTATIKSTVAREDFAKTKKKMG